MGKFEAKGEAAVSGPLGGLLLGRLGEAVYRTTVMSQEVKRSSPRPFTSRGRSSGPVG